MFSLNVTQRTEDCGSSLNSNKAERQQPENRKNRYSKLLVDECIFLSISHYSLPPTPNLEKTPDKATLSECIKIEARFWNNGEKKRKEKHTYSICI